SIQRFASNSLNLKVVSASADEVVQHEQRLDLVAKSGKCLWRG
ncbi:MAG: DNA polymerase III subunit epsilon, partial [Shewanella sp.]